jgi:formylglycine-generating enzyme required for sulfatase activity
MPLQTGQVLNNRYRIVKLLGQGGFGAVYRGWDLNMEASCAVKENLDTSPEAIRQFKREAIILHKLRHPNLPIVSDHFYVPGQGQYLVMDYVEGEDLQEKLNQAGGPLPESQVLQWIEQVCDALIYLHTQEPPTIHRDIKPANIKITPQGKAMLVDFGIAKVFDPVLRTTVGARAVTPGYSPPEQYGQGSTDARSDIYALGATLYTLLTNTVPADSVDVLTRRQPAPIAASKLNPAVTPTVEAALSRAMALDDRQRYQNAAEFKTALRTEIRQTVISTQPVLQPVLATQPVSVPHLGSEPIPKKRSSWVGWAVGVLVCLILGVVGWRSGLIETWLDQLKASSASSGTGTLQVSEVDWMAMVYIPAGPFEMGSIRFDDEKPVHKVTLKAYWIDQTEVTLRQFKTFENAQNYESKACGDGDNYPVACVTWYDAQAYCQWAGRRLPTEAEWEKAARGGLVGVQYPWGNGSPSCIPKAQNGAQYDACDGQTVPVKTFDVNGFGLYDMAGNVWEWVADWYQNDYYTNSPSHNPPGPEVGKNRVLRGGGWSYNGNYLRVAYRHGEVPEYASSNIGFRCAADPIAP